MSRPKFMVVKLSDLKIPFFMLLAVVAAFSFFMLTNKDKEATFSEATGGYQDGMYIANLAFADASMDVVVNVAKSQITSITLDGFDETERTLYSDLVNSIAFVNDYVTATQSLELPTDSTISASTSILMSAVSIALSDDAEATIKTTYQVPLLEELTPDTGMMPVDEISVEDDSTENAEALLDESDEMTESDVTADAVLLDPQE